MKLKLGIICGILSWGITTILIGIFNPIFSSHFSNINIIVPIITIIVTGFFGIIYIRNIESNEVIEGFLVGVLFSVIDIILDAIFFVLPKAGKLAIGKYSTHILSIALITILITTFLGYLAQMTIDLK